MSHLEQKGHPLETLAIVRNVLKSALQLGDRADLLAVDSPLLGAVPEFDSMAVVTIITMLEEHYGIRIDDDEITADTFATVGALVGFIGEKMQQ